ncbi:MAG: hypothetical protein IPM56_07420 [Ignavibacteriales bacterium]|nr:MAG: hypothetical protein IPM56_07420 [Ignavibacteriales bacterium]
MKKYLAAYLFFSLSCISFAQHFDLQFLPDNNTQLGIKFQRPFYKVDYGNFSFMMNNFNLYANIPVSNRLNLYVNIPVTQLKSEFNIPVPGYNTDSERIGTGNIYFGIQANFRFENERKLIMTFGTYLSSSDELMFGALPPNFYEIAFFVPYSLNLNYNFAYHQISESGFGYAVEYGNNIFIPYEGWKSELDVYMNYGINLHYTLDKLTTAVELIGTGFLATEERWYRNKFFNMLNFGFQWREGLWTPEVFYKIHLKKSIRELIDGVLSIGIRIQFDTPEYNSN